MGNEEGLYAQIDVGIRCWVLERRLLCGFLAVRGFGLDEFIDIGPGQLESGFLAVDGVEVT